MHSFCTSTIHAVAFVLLNKRQPDMMSLLRMLMSADYFDLRNSSRRDVVARKIFMQQWQCFSGFNVQYDTIRPGVPLDTILGAVNTHLDETHVIRLAFREAQPCERWLDSQKCICWWMSVRTRYTNCRIMMFQVYITGCQGGWELQDGNHWRVSLAGKVGLWSIKEQLLKFAASVATSEND
jgi:hypothetical protein